MHFVTYLTDLFICSPINLIHLKKETKMNLNDVVDGPVPGFFVLCGIR